MWQPAPSTLFPPSLCVALQMDEKYAFFAPIWRVMRDNNMSVEEVKEQVQYVALTVKQASQVSDLRHHHYLAEKLKVRPCLCGGVAVCAPGYWLVCWVVGTVEGEGVHEARTGAELLVGW